jgi:hypothetical protein
MLSGRRIRERPPDKPGQVDKPERNAVGAMAAVNAAMPADQDAPDGIILSPGSFLRRDHLSPGIRSGQPVHVVWPVDVAQEIFRGCAGRSASPNCRRPPGLQMVTNIFLPITVDCTSSLVS